MLDFLVPHDKPDAVEVPQDVLEELSAQVGQVFALREPAEQVLEVHHAYRETWELSTHLPNTSIPRQML